MADANNKQPLMLQIALQTIKIEEVWKDGKVGDVTTIEDLAAKVGMRITEGHLASARRRCLKNHGIWWERIRGAKAFQCVNGKDLIRIGENDLRKAHRASKRSLQKLSAADTKQMTDGEKTELNTLIAQHGTIAMFSTANTGKALEARKVAPNPVDLGKLLEAMK